MDSLARIRMSPDHDTARLSAEFRARGRLHVPNFLRDEDARRIHDALLRRTPWNLTVQHNGPKDISPSQWEALSSDQKERLAEEVIEGAKTRFVGRYCTLRISTDGEAFSGDISELVELSEFLNGAPYLDLVRSMTGNMQVALADAQATLYTPGDFLTEHDDKNESRKRVAAYVLNFTPHWKADWGGLLCFLDGEQRVTDTYEPAWNALNIFMVPQAHCVSFVTPYAGAGRYSVTGWMRTR